MPPRLKLGVIFGGRSGEHEISLLSVQSILAALDGDRYEVTRIGIDKQGRWLFDEDPLEQLMCGESARADAPRLPDPARLSELDVVFPVLHGTYGEDGTIQGLLDMAAIPYVGCGVLASALAMDKALSKTVFQAHGLPQMPWSLVQRAQWESDPASVLDQIETEHPYPLFTKPANLGSSVGIAKARTRGELAAGITDAARYDRKIVVERAVPNAREIEVSVLGNAEPVASLPGEIVPSNEFYDYAAKYLDGASAERIPAPIGPELTERVRDLAVKAFRAIDGRGYARVDFLLDDAAGELYLNEINTIPGFTSISMFPKLWQISGLTYPQLIDRLIELALESHADNARNRTDYQKTADA